MIKINHAVRAKYAVRIIEKLAGQKIFTLSEVQKVMLESLNECNQAPNYNDSYSSNYYQGMHENNLAFQKNNWLVSELDDIKKLNSNTIIELACGNAVFSRLVAPYCKHVYAVDWAESPTTKRLPINVTFLRRDIVQDELPRGDLVCSADFLEHLPPQLLQITVKKIVNLSPFGYHKIACYDDGHSHLSILPPWKWLFLFQNENPAYIVKKIEFRRDDLKKIVIVICNF